MLKKCIDVNPSEISAAQGAVFQDQLLSIVNAIKSTYDRMFFSSLNAISFANNQLLILQSLNSLRVLNQKRILLLSSETGSGKTSICLQYLKECWEGDLTNTTDYVPIYISLSKYRKNLKGFLKRHFRDDLLLTEENYKLLCEQGRMLLILDDYEVVERLDWLREYLREEKERPSWERLKIVVVCKDVHLMIRQENYESAFYPIDEEKLKVEWFQALNMGLLNDRDQQKVIQDYVNKKKGHVEKEGATIWEQSSYELYLQKTPEIKSLLCNSQMLTLFLRYLPEILEEPNEGKMSGKNITNGEVIKIYKMIVEKWIEYHREKQLIERDSLDDELEGDIWEVCKVLAGIMAEFDPKKNQVISKELVEILSHAIDKERFARALQLSPLRYERGNGLGFMNRFIQAYFEKMPNQKETLRERARLFRGEVKILREMDENDWENNLLNSTVLSERVVEEIAYKIREGDTYWVDRCKNYIRKSAENKDYAMASVNCGTILVKGYVNLSGEDFRNVRFSAFDRVVRKRIGANLSGGYFVASNFEGADLRYVNLSQSMLLMANLSYANLKHINLDAFPTIKHIHEKCAAKLINYQRNINILLTVCNEFICIWEYPDHKLIAYYQYSVSHHHYHPNSNFSEFIDHQMSMTSISMHSEKKVIACGFSDGTVQLFDLQTFKIKKILGVPVREDKVKCESSVIKIKVAFHSLTDLLVYAEVEKAKESFRPLFIYDIISDNVKTVKYESNVTDFDVSEIEETVLIGYENGAVILCNLINLTPIKVFRKNGDAVFTVKLDDYTKRAAILLCNNIIELFAMNQPSFICTHQLDNVGRLLYFSNRGKHIITTSSNKIYVRSVESLEIEYELVSQEGNIKDLSINSYDNILYMLGNQTLNVEAVDLNYKLKSSMIAHKGDIRYVELLEDDGIICIVTGDWDREAYKEVFDLTGFYDAKVTPLDNAYHVFIGDQCYWNIETGRLIRREKKDVIIGGPVYNGLNNIAASRDTNGNIYVEKNGQLYLINAPKDCTSKIHCIEINNAGNQLVVMRENTYKRDKSITESYLYLQYYSILDDIILTKENPINYFSFLDKFSLSISPDGKWIVYTVKNLIVILDHDSKSQYKLQVHDTVLDNCVDDNGNVYFGCDDGSIQCWMRENKDHKCIVSYRLKWTTNHPNKTLVLNQVKLKNVRHLSANHTRLFREYGVDVKLTDSKDKTVSVKIFDVNSKKTLRTYFDVYSNEYIDDIDQWYKEWYSSRKY